MASWYVDTIEINGGFLAGLQLRLARGLTCVIGPRGSGKSTLTEAIRFVMGSNSTSRSVRELLQANLGDSIVSVATAAGTNGTGYLVRRSTRQPALLSTPDGRPVSGVDLERGTFLPLDAYSSNEIEAIADESLGSRRRSLLDELCASELMQLQLGIAEKRRALDANRDAIRAAREQIAAIAEQIEELGDVRAKLAALPPMQADDVSAELTAAASRQQKNQAELGGLNNVGTVLIELHQRISGLGLPPTAFAAPAANNVNNKVLARVAVALEALRTQLAEHKKELITAIDATTEVISAARSELLDLHASQATGYAALQARYAAAGAAVRARAEATQRVAQLDALAAQKKELESQLGQIQTQRQQLKGAYLLERERVSTLREQVAKVLQQEAGAKVRVQVRRNADTIAYQQMLTLGLQGARVRNHEEIMDVLMRLRPEHLAQLVSGGLTEEFANETGLGQERAGKILESFQEKVDPMQLELAEVDDGISIELNVAPEGAPNYRDASELSRGQKCTALLPLLLARRDTPLIVDQPEDNLDNHFIYETVVESIRRLKARRQMVFVTHNANIPVLGEADLVVVLDSDGRKGFVKKSGSLDECRDEIVDLLEGGEEAFERRRQRYAR